ncbi:NAD(P)-dependent alcohol dehydrogenase [Cryobacterium sp. TMT2-14]|uniref:NAD(P)-dependent alcohol dehydrogenase n=1 Tax=Cryobacterium sp. TMT2-14 TaxID=1259245 RepID=UPI00106B1A58|nr:NAD(P)-dependent alcohol dehydrogenase [Cryobacterium sp. TMT2-14]TFC33005.1 NAD(P)-dependent alcohol dehydrogenase [Cryobacterium sp. TMT2-14]
MKAIVQRDYGDVEVLKVEDIDHPVVGQNDVLVRLVAASLNHADWIHMSGTPLVARLAFGTRRPKAMTRGKDVAGVVESVGTNVTAFRQGDEVYGELSSGTFAEYVAAPASLLARKPVNLTFEQAAAVPLSGMTALVGLRDAGSVTPGQRVLVNGASGGVGTFAVQIAKALGAEVTAVSSAANAALVQSLGADHVVDYGRDDFTRGTARHNVIFDLIGNHTLTELRSALISKGVLVLSSGTGGRVVGPTGRILKAVAISPFIGQKLKPFTQNGSTKTLNERRDLIEAGRVTPVIDRIYGLAGVPAAMRYFVDEHARGKVAISV